MPIPLGVLAVAGAGGGGGAAGNAYEWLETALPSTGDSTVTFSNLNTTYGSTYQHLQLRIVSKRGSNRFGVQFNGDTGSNYAMHFLFGTGSTVSSGATTSTTAITTNVGRTAGGDSSVGASIVDILDPFETTKNTTVRSLTGNQLQGLIVLYSGVWLNTNALTSLSVVQTEPSSGVSTWETGTRISLYGMRSS
jgi:hypothetical protein